jgi:hypothetical protein
MIDEYEKLLAGLDDLHWAGLNRAGGPAEDIPHQLRTMCGDGQEAREQAFNDLMDNIEHQGPRYQVTAFTVPFLARIATVGPLSIREELLRVLTGLAVDEYAEFKIATGIDTVARRARAAPYTTDKALAWYDGQLAVEQNEVEQDEQRRDRLHGGRAATVEGYLMNSADAALRS